MVDKLRDSKGKLIVAFFMIYFIWGSTYLAIKFAIETMPPFAMAGVRFIIAGAILYGIMRFRGVPAPTWPEVKHLSIIGLLLFLGGNGGVVWAEQFVDSGLAALLVATVPLWMITLDWLWLGNPRPNSRAIAGLALGIFGIFLLVDPAEITGSNINIPGAVGIIVASFLWAIGSVFSKKATLHLAASYIFTDDTPVNQVGSLAENAFRGALTQNVNVNAVVAGIGIDWDF